GPRARGGRAPGPGTGRRPPEGTPVSHMTELGARLWDQVGRVVVGQGEALDLIIAALSVNGHVLLEGAPGTGKTLLATTFSRVLGLRFRRLQLTPDMLPSGVTGTMILREGQLSFREGPVFTNVLLAAE